MERARSFECCYCGREIVGPGNNPYDFSEDFYNKHARSDMCCDKCYESVVVPRKMRNTMQTG